MTDKTLSNEVNNLFETLSTVFSSLTDALPAIESQMEQMRQKLEKVEINVNDTKINLGESMEQSFKTKLDEARLGFSFLNTFAKTMVRNGAPTNFTMENFPDMVSKIQSAVMESFPLETSTEPISEVGSEPTSDSNN